MLQITSVTIPAGQQNSSVCDTGITQVVAVYIKSDVILDNGDNVAFSGSFDGQEFYPIVDATGQSLNTNLSPGYYATIEPSSSYALPRFIQLAYNATESSAFDIYIVTREV